MQGRSKRKSCLNNPYTSRSASTIYNSKILQTLPHSSLRVQQISPSWSKHKILAPALFLSKKLGKREEIPKKMRNLVGSFDCINKLKYALRQAFAQQKQLSTRVFSGSEAEPTTRKKKSVMKRNYLTTNYFGGGNSVISGLASIFAPLQKDGSWSCQRAIIAIILMYFAPGSPQNTPSNLPEEPSETASADIIKVRRLALTSLKRTQSQSFWAL